MEKRVAAGHVLALVWQQKFDAGADAEGTRNPDFTFLSNTPN
jgi:hypothetical protein